MRFSHSLSFSSFLTKKLHKQRYVWDMEWKSKDTHKNFLEKKLSPVKIVVKENIYLGTLWRSSTYKFYESFGTKCMYIIFIMHDAYSQYKKVWKVMRDITLFLLLQKLWCGDIMWNKNKSECVLSYFFVFFMTKSRSIGEHSWNTRWTWKKVEITSKLKFIHA